MNCPGRVPASAVTLTPIHTPEPPYAAGAHATVVADVHAVLLHASATAMDAVGVTATQPKCRPLIVTDPPEVRPMFGGLLTLTHGAVTPYNSSFDVRLGLSASGRSRPTMTSRNWAAQFCR